MWNWFSPRPRRGRRVYILLFLLCLTFRLSSQDFAAVNPPVEIPVSLVLQGVPSGEVLARFPGADLYRREILTKISSLLNRENYENILAGDGEVVTLDFLRRLGLSVTFDEQLLVLDIRIAAALMPPSLIFVRERPDSPDQSKITSAPFSAYLNYTGGVDFLYEDYFSSEGVSFPARLDLMPAFQFHQWVLEGTFLFRTPPETAAEVQTLRLVREFIGTGLRLTAGTVDPNWDGVVVSSSALGTPGGAGTAPVETDVIVEEPSQVEVYLNNRLLKRMRVPAGVHSLTEIPYSSGLNSLKVVVTGADGTKKIYESSHPFDANLLPRGESTFSLGGGWPRIDAVSPVMTGEFSLGLSRILTAGVKGQTDFARYTGTLNTTWATLLGNLGAAASVSGSPDLTPQLYLALRYRLSLPHIRLAPVFGAGAEYFDPEFRSSIFQAVASSHRWVLNFSYGQLLPFSAYLNLGASYRFNPRGEDGTGRVSATLLSRFGESVGFAFSYGGEFSRSGIGSWRGALTWTITPASGGSSVIVSQDLTSGEASAGYSAPRGNLLVKGFPPAISDTAVLEGNLALRPGFFNLFLGNSLMYAEGEYLKNRFSAGAAGAILFAGGRFAFTPPVTDSFALIVPSEEMEDRLLRIYGTGIPETETTGRVAALHELASYREISLAMDLPEADPDTVIDRERVGIYPSYRSGTLIKPALRRSIYGEGLLLDDQERPLILKALKISRWDNPAGTGEASLSFSDEQGLFQFHNLFPGRYRLSLAADPAVQGEFTLAAGGESPVSLGTLVLSLKENEQ